MIKFIEIAYYFDINTLSNQFSHIKSAQLHVKYEVFGLTFSQQIPSIVYKRIWFIDKLFINGWIMHISFFFNIDYALLITTSCTPFSHDQWTGYNVL